MPRLHRKDYAEENGYRIVSAVVNGATSSAAQVTCHECGFTDTLAMSKHMPAHIIHSKLGQRGWDCRKPRRMVCPRCQDIAAAAARARHARPPAAPVTPIDSQLASAAAPAPEPVPQPIIIEPKKEVEPMQPAPKPVSVVIAPQPLTPAAMRSVFNLLEQHFSTDTGNYTTGWSDRKISEEAGVAMIHVSRIREEAFGPIKADPELVAIRAEQERLSKAQEKLMDDLFALGKRVELYAEKNGVK